MSSQEVRDALELLDAKERSREKAVWWFFRITAIVAGFLAACTLCGSLGYSCYVANNSGVAFFDSICSECNGVGWKTCDTCKYIQVREQGPNHGTIPCARCGGKGKTSTTTPRGGQ